MIGFARIVTKPPETQPKRLAILAKIGTSQSPITVWASVYDIMDPLFYRLQIAITLQPFLRHDAQLLVDSRKKISDLKGASDCSSDASYAQRLLRVLPAAPVSLTAMTHVTMQVPIIRLDQHLRYHPTREHTERW